MNKVLTGDELFFAKVKNGAIIPSKRDEDAGYDIYACFEEDFMVIPPHTTKLIPTGVASAFSPKYVAILKERGSNGVKGIAQRSGVIDSGYRSEWFVPLTNTNDVPVYIVKHHKKGLKEYVQHIAPEAIIYPYEKGIAQILFVEVPKMEVNEVDYETLQEFASERGMGALGSSGK